MFTFSLGLTNWQTNKTNCLTPSHMCMQGNNICCTWQSHVVSVASCVKATNQVCYYTKVFMCTKQYILSHNKWPGYIVSWTWCLHCSSWGVVAIHCARSRVERPWTVWREMWTYLFIVAERHSAAVTGVLRLVGLTHGGIEILTVTTHMWEKLAGLLKPDCQSTGRTAKMEK